jgi:hypothetical protein
VPIDIPPGRTSQDGDSTPRAPVPAAARGAAIARPNQPSQHSRPPSPPVHVHGMLELQFTTSV